MVKSSSQSCKAHFRKNRSISMSCRKAVESCGLFAAHAGAKTQSFDRLYAASCRSLASASKNSRCDQCPFIILPCTRGQTSRSVLYRLTNMHSESCGVYGSPDGKLCALLRSSGEITLYELIPEMKHRCAFYSFCFLDCLILLSKAFENTRSIR